MAALLQKTRILAYGEYVSALGFSRAAPWRLLSGPGSRKNMRPRAATARGRAARGNAAVTFFSTACYGFEPVHLALGTAWSVSITGMPSSMG